jgi:carboxylesterase
VGRSEEITVVLPGAEGFSHVGAAAGVLLCHGFTSTPQSLGTWPTDLASAGYHVEVPLLPGHGTTWQDMNRSTWQDWYGTVDVTLAQLRTRCTTVFVGGLSMGGTLALRLAIEATEHGTDVAGLILVNPAVKFEHPLLPLLPVLKHVVPSFPAISNDIKKPGATELAYDRSPLRAVASQMSLMADVRGRLGVVTQPILLMRSAADHVLPARSSQLVLDGVRSTDLTDIVLQDSYHVATLDNDAEQISKESLSFISRLSSGGKP